MDVSVLSRKVSIHGTVIDSREYVKFGNNELSVLVTVWNSRGGYRETGCNPSFCRNHLLTVYVPSEGWSSGAQREDLSLSGHISPCLVVLYIHLISERE